MAASDDVPALLAHRGWARRYPENTLPALEAAMGVGARFIEFDVQLTADGVPVLLHDDSLRRTGGADTVVMDEPFDTLRSARVGEVDRFGAAFADVPLPTLDDALALLEVWPGVTAFVEIKRESLRRFGVATVVDQVMDRLAPVGERAIPISFDLECLDRARTRGAAGIGWVLDDLDEATHDAAEKMAPEHLIVDHRKLTTAPLWPGPWRWTSYEVDTAALGLALLDRGVDLVSTMAIGELQEDAALRARLRNGASG